jgi:sugar/nucleoside kinase (ribokinase family)
MAAARDGRFRWVHFEGRAVRVAADAMRALQSLARPPIISVEIEKKRDDDVEQLVPLADVVVVSREYATTVRGLPDAPSTIAWAEKLVQHR